MRVCSVPVRSAAVCCAWARSVADRLHLVVVVVVSVCVLLATSGSSALHLEASHTHKHTHARTHRYYAKARQLWNKWSKLHRHRVQSYSTVSADIHPNLTHGSRLVPWVPTTLPLSKRDYYDLYNNNDNDNIKSICIGLVPLPYSSS